MPILSGHGHGCAVTNPSMSPETPSAMTSPIAIVASDRPAAASDSPRERGPGATQAQKICSPAAPGHEDAGELEQAVREDVQHEDVAATEGRS